MRAGKQVAWETVIRRTAAWTNGPTYEEIAAMPDMRAIAREIRFIPENRYERLDIPHGQQKICTMRGLRGHFRADHSDRISEFFFPETLYPSCSAARFRLEVLSGTGVYDPALAEFLSDGKGSWRRWLLVLEKVKATVSSRALLPRDHPLFQPGEVSGEFVVIGSPTPMHDLVLPPPGSPLAFDEIL